MIPHMEMGVPHFIWGCANPHFHMGIPIWKWGAISFDCPYGNGDSPFPYGDVSIPGQNFWRPKFLVMRWRLVRDPMAGQNYSPCFHTKSPHMETGRQTKKFPFGDSPFQNRVCSHLGLNIYTSNFCIGEAFGFEVSSEHRSRGRGASTISPQATQISHNFHTWRKCEHSFWKICDIN